jgi:hypothetical protein
MMLCSVLGRGRACSKRICPGPIGRQVDVGLSCVDPFYSTMGGACGQMVDLVAISLAMAKARPRLGRRSRRSGAGLCKLSRSSRCTSLSS